MQLIHEFMQLPQDFTFRKCGTQEYEADVVIFNERGKTKQAIKLKALVGCFCGMPKVFSCYLSSGVKEGNRMWAQCALHLRQYNDALLINDTLRMVDAFRSLDAFYRTKLNTAIDGTDHFLLALFRGMNSGGKGSTLGFLTFSTLDKHPGFFHPENKTELRTVAEDSRYENPKMFELEKVLLQQFGPAAASRAILFSKTRKSTHCLLDWLKTNMALQGAGINAAILTGSGSGLSHMTQVRSGALE